MSLCAAAKHFNRFPTHHRLRLLGFQFCPPGIRAWVLEWLNAPRLGAGASIILSALGPHHLAVSGDQNPQVSARNYAPNLGRFNVCLYVEIQRYADVHVLQVFWLAISDRALKRKRNLNSSSFSIRRGGNFDAKPTIWPFVVDLSV